MKKLAIVLTLLATSAVAQNRPMTPGMTCDAVQRMVAQRGAVVLGFGPDLYDRVVSTPRFCLPGEVLVPISVPTRNGDCFAGYTCREGNTRDW